MTRLRSRRPRWTSTVRPWLITLALLALYGLAVGGSASLVAH